MKKLILIIIAAALLVPAVSLYAQPVANPILAQKLKEAQASLNEGARARELVPKEIKQFQYRINKLKAAIAKRERAKGFLSPIEEDRYNNQLDDLLNDIDYKRSEPEVQVPPPPQPKLPPPPPPVLPPPPGY